MAKAFSIRDFLGDDTQLQESESDVFEKISIYDIESNPKNEYTMSEIEKIKDSIYALGGVQQNIVLVRCTKGASHKYLALDGHRRLVASRELVKEGYSEFEFVPAVIKGQIDVDMENAMLVLMNSTQRNKTDWEKVMEHMRLKEIIPKLKKRQKLDGRTRDIEADLLGVSQTQVNIYNTIGTSLNTELMELFKIGQIGISLAYEAARQNPDIQKQLAEMAHDNSNISEEDIKSLACSRTIEGQLKVPEIQTENVSESDTFEKPSVTPESVPRKKQEICYTSNENDIDNVIYFIFRMDFPEDKLQEIITCFRQAENYTVASIGAELIFDKILPYENSEVKVTYQSGYQIEYIHTGKIYNIPIAYFWAGFKRKFESDWTQEEPEQTIQEEVIKNVSESDTSEMDEIKADMWQNISFRGGYTLDMIDCQIEKYKKYLNLALGEGDLPNFVSEYNCLLDALELLREKFTEEEA